MKSILIFLKKRMVVAIPLAMFTGLIFGKLFPAVWLKNLIVPLTFLMVYPMMVTMNFKSLLKGGDFKLQATAFIMNFCFLPFIAFLTGKFFFPDRPMMVLGLFLCGLLPTSGMTISWTGFAKGNMGSAVKMTVLSLIAGSILVPFYVKFFMGTVINIPLFNIFKQIIVVVFAPMIAGFFTKKILLMKFSEKEFNRDIKQIFPGLSVLGVVAIVFVAMSLKAKVILSEPSMILTLIMPLFLLYFFNFTLSSIVARILFNREDGIAFVYGTVMRNLSIALAIVMTVFGKEAYDSALIIAFAYIIQVQGAAFYVKLTDRIFPLDNKENNADICNGIADPA